MNITQIAQQSGNDFFYETKHPVDTTVLVDIASTYIFLVGYFPEPPPPTNKFKASFLGTFLRILLIYYYHETLSLLYFNAIRYVMHNYTLSS